LAAPPGEFNEVIAGEELLPSMSGLDIYILPYPDVKTLLGSPLDDNMLSDIMR
jgi:hypothetical protein